jgi:hypothetical protein
MLSSLPPAKSIQSRADIQDHIFHPAAIRYRAQTKGRILRDASTTDRWRVELARFAVPFGAIGIVRGYEQYLATYANATYTDVTGSPFGDVDAGLVVTWFMRLSPWTGREFDWVNETNYGDGMPGIPHPDFADQSNIWYPTSSGSEGQNLRLIVPGGYVLRAFIQIGATSTRPAVAALLKGGLQGEVSDSGLENHVRGAW